MHYLAMCVSVLLMLYERWKGTKTVHEVKGPGNALGNLQGYCVRGYQLTIFCQRKEYRVKYDKWYIPNRSRYTYRVTSLVTNDAPCVLKQACELDVDLPAFVSRFNFDQVIFKSVVNAYLDLLEKRIGTLECA